jgi:geranylgeranylglycerol-phosphate geranylgeranyltransferase
VRSASIPRLRAALELARWPNAAMAAGAVLLGAWWAAGTVPARAGWAALAAVTLTTAANAWNDLADIEIDRVAHPDRPLPGGRLTTRAASRIACAAAAASVPLAAAARPALGALTVAVLAAMRAYSPSLKRTGLAGNVAVAVLASLPFVYGAWAAGRPAAGWMLVLVGAPLHFAREVAKDLDDAPADAAARCTVPLRFGAIAARGIVVGAAVVFVALFILVAVRAAPFALAAVPAIALSAEAARLAWAGRRGSPALFKAAMLCAMAAFATSRL